MNKIILIDSDETLRRSDGTISDRTKKAIKKNIESGNFVIICTGRPRYHTIKIMKESGSSSIIVSSNGSEIFDVENNNIIDSVFLDNDECIEIINLCFENDLRVIFTIENSEYVTKYTKNDNQIILDQSNYIELLGNKKIKQCMIVSDNIKGINKIKKFVESSKKIRIINGTVNFRKKHDNWISIGHIKSSKGYALKRIANYLNISIENTIAIGNDYNDISMLDEAGFSVAVANAYDEVKKHADYITKSNDEDGVAIVLEKILKK